MKIKRGTIKQILMSRDGMSANDSDRLIQEASDDLHTLLAEGDLAAAENVCEDWFGLEPDYLDELY